MTIPPGSIIDANEIQPGPCRPKMPVKWEVGVGIGIVVIILGLFFCLVLFKKACLKKKASVKPMEERTLLKTANYTVTRSWDQLHVKFHSQRFFKSFSDTLSTRYPKLKGISSRRETEGAASSSSGEPVWLKIFKDSRIVIVTDKGNNSWIFNDFQNICKNLVILEDDTVSNNSLAPHNVSLQPRLATIGEVITEGAVCQTLAFAVDHVVKNSATETEIRFTQSKSYIKFKKVLHAKYPNISWTKYRERDCTQVQTSRSGTLTIHLWEGSQTVWLCGPGRQDWYYSEFSKLDTLETMDKTVSMVSEKT